VADGAGTLEALAEPLGLSSVAVDVHDSLGRVASAAFGLASGALGGRGRAARVAVVEVVDAADSHGTGELIVAAVAAGASTVLVAAGGGAPVDGGAGALRAIRAAGGLGRASIVVLCDPRGVVSGSFAAALSAELGAELVAGAPFVLDQVGFDVRMRAARAVIAGDGRLDRSSLAGKAFSEVATRARQAGVPSYAVVGHNALSTFDQRILDLQIVLEARTLAELERAGAELAALI
jgi:glycerate kinase